jgi:hypothetical protein
MKVVLIVSIFEKIGGCFRPQNLVAPQFPTHLEKKILISYNCNHFLALLLVHIELCKPFSILLLGL